MKKIASERCSSNQHRWHQGQRSGTLRVALSRMMPQSARILTTVCPKPAVSLEDSQREYGRVIQSACPQRFRYTEPSYSADLAFLPEADQATWEVSPTLLALHPWHPMARPRHERRSPQESQPAQQRVHLASGATALGWPLIELFISLLIGFVVCDWSFNAEMVEQVLCTCFLYDLW